jgi:hypothetical protein
MIKMTKEQLIKLGLDETLAAKVAETWTEAIKGFIPKTRFDEVNEAKKQLEADIKARDAQLETLKKSTGDVEALKTKITNLQEANKTAKADYEAKIKQMQIDNAVTAALTGAKAKNLKAVRALLDLEKAELDGETVKGLADQIKKLQEAEDTKFLFDDDSSQQTKLKGVKPGESGDKGYPADKKPSEMTYTELCAYMEANPGAEI